MWNTPSQNTFPLAHTIRRKGASLPDVERLDHAVNTSSIIIKAALFRAKARLLNQAANDLCHPNRETTNVLFYDMQNICGRGAEPDNAAKAPAGQPHPSLLFAPRSAESQDRYCHIHFELSTLHVRRVQFCSRQFACRVGACLPRCFMSMQHVDLAEAVQVHLDLGAKRSVGVHWGTFSLADEPLDQPIHELDSARRAKGVAETEFWIMPIGGTRCISPRSIRYQTATQVQSLHQ